jgi:hypothetical protein
MYTYIYLLSTGMFLLYTHIHATMYICMHKHTYLAWASVSATSKCCIHTYICLFYACICYIHMHTYTCIHNWYGPQHLPRQSAAYIHISVCVCIHIYFVHMYIYIYTHTYIHMHTYLACASASATSKCCTRLEVFLLPDDVDTRASRFMSASTCRHEEPHHYVRV